MDAACATALAEFQAASARAVDAFVHATGERETAILRCEATLLQRQASVAEREAAVTYREEAVRKREADLREITDSKAPFESSSGRLPASPARAHARLPASPCSPSPGTSRLKELFEQKAIDSLERATAAKRRSSGQGRERRSSIGTSSFGFGSYGVRATERCGFEAKTRVEDALAGASKAADASDLPPERASEGLCLSQGVRAGAAEDVQQSSQQSGAAKGPRQVSAEGRRVLYEKLFDFYMLHNPSKLLSDEPTSRAADDLCAVGDNAHVLEVVRWYYGKEAELNQQLQTTYGLDLSSLDNPLECIPALPTAASHGHSATNVDCAASVVDGPEMSLRINLAPCVELADDSQAGDRAGTEIATDAPEAVLLGTGAAANVRWVRAADEERKAII